MLLKHIFSLIAITSLPFNIYGLQSSQPRIAIIGAGVGGTSAGYFLSQTPGLKPIIDVYTKDAVGGRLSTLLVGGEEYETGGSILHPRNHYVKQFVKKFGLKSKKGIDGKFGLYDGSQFVYQEGKWSALNFMSLLWRYGFSLVKVNSMIGDMLDKFDRIYSIQDQGYAFSNVGDILSAMDPSFNLMLENSLENGLRERGISDTFIHELAMAVMRVNYGQTTSAHQFVGSVSLAGAESGLWSVYGGNKKVPEALLNVSGANLLKKEIESVHLSSDGRFSLWFKEDDEESPLYDSVVLATPLTTDMSSIKFINFPQRFNFPGRYHRTVCTMVQGEVNNETFRFSEESITDQIFTINGSVFFNSLARNYPVNTDDGTKDFPPVWKVFSNEPLTPEQFKILFSKINESKVVDWKAYPEYSDSSQPLGNFTLHPGLYHVNAIEFAASAIEMSIIAARNVALLIASHFGIDIQDQHTHNFHVEL